MGYELRLDLKVNFLTIGSEKMEKPKVISFIAVGEIREKKAI